MSDLKRFFKHSSIYAIGNLINRLGAFLLLPVYTNYLTVSEYGILEIFYIISSVVSGFLAVGMAHATLRFYFDYKSQDDRNASISTNYIGSFLVTLVGVLLISIFTTQLSTSVFSSEEYTLGIYLILVTLVLELSSQICLAYIRALEYSVFFVIISIVKLIIQVSVNSYLVIFEGAGITGILIGNLITVFVGWLVLSVFTLKRCGFSFHFEKFKPVVKYCVPFLLSTIMSLISVNADRFILNYLVSLEALGLYALALKFSMIIEQLIGEPFNRSYGAFRYTVMDNDNAAKIQSVIVKYLLIISVFFAIAMSFFVKDVLVFMSNESFWRAADLVPIIMVAAVIKIVSYPLQTGILVAKKTGYLFYFTTIGAAVSAVGSYLLISIIGLVGACISLVVTQAVIMVITNYYSQKFFKVDYDYKRMLLLIMFSVLVFIPSMYLDDFSTLSSILIKVLLLMLLLISVFYGAVLTKQEISSVKEFLYKKLPSRSKT